MDGLIRPSVVMTRSIIDNSLLLFLLFSCTLPPVGLIQRRLLMEEHRIEVPMSEERQPKHLRELGASCAVFAERVNEVISPSCRVATESDEESVTIGFFMGSSSFPSCICTFRLPDACAVIFCVSSAVQPCGWMDGAKRFQDLFRSALDEISRYRSNQTGPIRHLAETLTVIPVPPSPFPLSDSPMTV